jgi:hypothetical protein
MTDVPAPLTDADHLLATYTVEPVNPAAVPLRLRCKRCPWQATGIPAALLGRAQQHDLAHSHQDGRTRP